MGGPPRPRNDPRKEIAANHVARLAIGATESLSRNFRLSQAHVKADVVPRVRSERPVLSPDHPSDAPPPWRRPASIPRWKAAPCRAPAVAPSPPAGMVLLCYDLGSCSWTVDYGRLGGHLPFPGGAGLLRYNVVRSPRRLQVSAQVGATVACTAADFCVHQPGAASHPTGSADAGIRAVLVQVAGAAIHVAGTLPSLC
jgi:hypothetical protein